MKCNTNQSHRRHRGRACGVSVSPKGLGDAAFARTTLPSSVIQALDLALADERQAHLDYTAIVERFGEVRPFSNIVHAEARHINALLPIYAHYNAPIPTNDHVVDRDIETLSLTDLCQKGIDAEIENVRLYDEQLLPAVEDYPDIAGIFQRLRDASANRHLPAFQRCVERHGRPGGGRGRGHS